MYILFSSHLFGLQNNVISCTNTTHYRPTDFRTFSSKIIWSPVAIRTGAGTICRHRTLFLSCTAFKELQQFTHPFPLSLSHTPGILQPIESARQICPLSIAKPPSPKGRTKHLSTVPAPHHTPQQKCVLQKTQRERNERYDGKYLLRGLDFTIWSIFSFAQTMRKACGWNVPLLADSKQALRRPVCPSKRLLLLRRLGATVLMKASCPKQYAQCGRIFTTADDNLWASTCAGERMEGIAAVSQRACTSYCSHPHKGAHGGGRLEVPVST